MTLFDLIPLWASMTAAVLAIGLVFFSQSSGLIRTLVDPIIHPIFQLLFTFIVLLLCGWLPLEDGIGFIFFIVFVVSCRNIKIPGKSFYPQNDWIAFSQVLAIVLAILNVYLIKQKGMLFLSSDVAVARQEFWVGWGMLKRLNELGVGLLMISAALLWAERRKGRAILMGCLSGYLAMTLGSRSGLLMCLFAYGAYLHFQARKVSNWRLITVGACLGISSLVAFYIMYGPTFIPAFAYRLLADSDGPVYYFSDKMYNSLRLGPGYPFDILLVAARLRPVPAYSPIGWQILALHFGIDNLQGPNPQMFAESHVLFRSYSILWYPICALIFVLIRGSVRNPYTFFLGMFFLGPFLMDLEYAGSQIFSILLIIALLTLFLGARWFLRMAATPSRISLEAL